MEYIVNVCIMAWKIIETYKLSETKLQDSLHVKAN